MVSWDSDGRTYKVDEGYICSREREAQEIAWGQVVGRFSGSLGTLEGKWSLELYEGQVGWQKAQWVSMSSA